MLEPTAPPCVQRVGKVLMTFCVGALSACGSGAPERGQAPADFSLFLGVGRQDGSARRTELWLRPRPGTERVWSLRLRRAEAGELPLLFDHVAAREVSGHRVDRLYRDLLRANAFAIPTWLENAPVAEAAPLTLRLQSRGAFRQCTAVGRMDDRLLRTLRSIDRWSTLRFAPWPDWLAPFFGENDPRPELAADAEAAVRMHRAWLTEEPGLARLHLDLFALFVALGREDQARFELERLPTELEGLRPELLERLR